MLVIFFALRLSHPHCPFDQQCLHAWTSALIARCFSTGVLAADITRLIVESQQGIYSSLGSNFWSLEVVKGYQLELAQPPS